MPIFRVLSSDICLAMVLAVSVSAACGQEPRSALRASPPRHTLVGRLSLPGGPGSRGVEVIVETAERGSEARKIWLLFDEEGNFFHTFEGFGKPVVPDAMDLGKKINMSPQKVRALRKQIQKKVEKHWRGKLS